MQKVKLICEDCKQEFEYEFVFDNLAECPHCGANWQVNWLATWDIEKKPWIVGPWRGEETKKFTELEKIDWIEEERKRKLLFEKETKHDVEL